jgi:hypothetical protein
MERELALDDVQVGVANAAGAHLDQQLAGTRLGNGDLSKRE